MKAGHPYTTFHAVPPLHPGLAWLTLLLDLYPALEGSEQLQLPSSVQFMDEPAEHDNYIPSNYECHQRQE